MHRPNKEWFIKEERRKAWCLCLICIIHLEGSTKRSVPGEGRDLDWATAKHLAVDKSLRLCMETQRIQSWRGFHLQGGGVGGFILPICSEWNANAYTSEAL